MSKWEEIGIGTAWVRGEQTLDLLSRLNLEFGDRSDMGVGGRRAVVDT